MYLRPMVCLRAARQTRSMDTNNVAQYMTMVGQPTIVWPILLVLSIISIRWLKRDRQNLQRSKDLQDYRLALQLLQQMILQDPTNAQAYWQMGQVYEAMGM